MTQTSTALVIFAKAPIAGFAKTRLIPQLGAAGAAQLASQLLAHALTQALATPFTHIELCVTPNVAQPHFVALQQQHGARLHLTDQGEGDLGQRMQGAFERLLPQFAHVLLMGTDAPALDCLRLQQADAALAQRPAVFIPAFDGGYTLVGLTTNTPEIFSQMPWSTAQVMAQTRLRLAAKNVAWQELAPMSDIDEPTDLCHLPADWPALPSVPTQ